MKDLSRFYALVKTFEACADDSDKVASEGFDYAAGKATAFRFAAQWLREELGFYEEASR